MTRPAAHDAGTLPTRSLAPYALRLALLVLAGDALVRLVPLLGLLLTHWVTVPFAAWIVSRRFVRTVRRPILRPERLHLTLLSTCILVVGQLALRALPSSGDIGFTPTGPGGAFALGGLAILGLVWGTAFDLVLAYLGFTLFGARAAKQLLGAAPAEHSASDVADPTALRMLADKEVRSQEYLLRGVGLAVMWPMVGLMGMLILGIGTTALLEFAGVENRSNDLTIKVMGAYGVLLLLAYRWIIPRLAMQVFPSHRMVLWLRRFNQANLRPFPFAPFLERACRGIAVPITLQDAVVSASPIRVKSRRGRARMARLLAALDAEAGVPQGLTVVSCTNQEWREWVSTFVARADAIIIDVTALSDSLHWELRESLRLLTPERLTLAFGHRDGEDNAIPASVLEELRAVIGSDAVDRCSQFHYTIPRRRFSLRRLFQRRDRLGGYQLPKPEQRRYESMLADALSTAFGAAGSRVPSGE